MTEIDAWREDWRREAAAIAAGQPYRPRVVLSRPPEPNLSITRLSRRRQLASVMQCGGTMLEAAQKCGISHFAVLGLCHRAGGKAAFIEKYAGGEA